MKHAAQTSESIELGILLALSGGLMDAYSYIGRGKVFANAQTGNILLFGVKLSERDFGGAAHYLFPVLAFTFGIALADMVREHGSRKVHWRQAAVLFEALILVLVSLIPGRLNLLANSLTSFACGIQVQTFRKIHGNAIATTMCIGNLRSGTQQLCAYFRTGERKNLDSGFLYYGIILCFVVGAVIGNFLVKAFLYRAIIASALILCVAFLLMFIDREKELLDGKKG